MAIDLRQFRWNNLARSTLAAGINDAETEIELVDGSAFPDTDPLGEFIIENDAVVPLVVWDEAEETLEIMYATAKDGNTFTVERGAEGTTPQIWEAGAHVVNTALAGFFQQQVAVTAAPTAPVLSGQLNSDGVSYDLTWTAATVDADDEVLAYDIYRDDGDGYGYALVTSVDGATLTYNDAGIDLGSGATFTWYVVARAKVGGAGTASNTISSLVSILMAGFTAGGVFISSDFQVAVRYYDEHTKLPNASISTAGGVYSSERNEILLGISNDQTSPFALSVDGGETFGLFPKLGLDGGSTSKDIEGNSILWVPDFNLGDGYYVVLFNDNAQANNAWYSANGRDWTEGLIDAGSTSIRGFGAAYSPTLQRAVFVGDGPATRQDAIYTDDGETFTSVSHTHTTTAALEDVCWDSVNEVFVAIHQGLPLAVSYSVDGATWVENSSVGSFTAGAAFEQVIFDPVRQVCLALSGDGEIYEGSYNGAWSQQVDLADVVRSIVYDDVRDALYVAGLDAFWQSLDGGVTWDNTNEGFHDHTGMGKVFMARAPSPSNSHIVAQLAGATAGLGPSKLYRSSDAGASWQAVILPEDVLFSSIAYDPNYDRWWICKEASVGVTTLYYSDDDLETWTPKTISTANITGWTEISVLSTGELVVTDSTGQRAVPFAYSSDGGATWTDGVASASFSCRAMFYAQGRYFAAANAGGANTSAIESALSDTWVPSSLGITAFECIALHAALNRVFACSDLQAPRYIDSVDSSWTNSDPSVNVTVGSTELSMAYDPDKEKILLFTGNNVYSCDTGEDDWVQENVEAMSACQYAVRVGDGMYVGALNSVQGPARFTYRGGKWRQVFTETLTGPLSGDDVVIAVKGEYSMPAAQAGPVTWDFTQEPPSVFWAQWGSFDGEVQPSVAGKALYGYGCDTFTASATYMDGFWPTDEERVSVSISDLGFKVGFRWLGSACNGGVTAQDNYFGVISSEGPGGDVFPTGVAIEVNAVGGAATDGNTVDIGYFDGTSTTFNAFTNSGGPYALASTDKNVCQQHEASFSISGTTLSLYFNDVLVDSFTLTAGEITTITGINKPAFLAPTNKTQDMIDFYLFKLGDASVALA